MQTFIQTGSAVSGKGYRWWQIGDDLQACDPPIASDTANREWTNWPSYDDFCLVLQQLEGKLSLLLILPGDNSVIPLWRRKDHQNRGLSYSLAWIADSHEDNLALRRLAASILFTAPIGLSAWQQIDWLSELDACVDKDHESAAGFSVQQRALTRMVEKLVNRSTALPTTTLRPDNTQIAHDSLEKRQEIAAFLASDQPLPPYSYLVLVTGQGYDKLAEQAKQLWCVLSNAVDSVRWQPLKPKINPFSGGKTEHKPTANKILRWILEPFITKDDGHKQSSNKDGAQKKTLQNCQALLLLLIIWGTGFWTGLHMNPLPNRNLSVKKSMTPIVTKTVQTNARIAPHNSARRNP